MNKLRRKEINNIITMLKKFAQDVGQGNIDNIIECVDDFIDQIQCVFDEEETYKENIPENLQNGFRYAQSEEACDNLENAVDELEYIDCDDSIDDLTNAILNTIKYLQNAII